MKIGPYQSHVIADALPLMSDGELRNLAEDIKRHKLRRKIVLYEGQVLDGRCRGLACEIAGVEPQYEDYVGDDPIGFVASENIYGRRHLTDGQRWSSLQRLREINRKLVKAGERQASLLMPDKEVDALTATAKRQGVPELVEMLEQGRATAAIAATVSQAPPDEQRKWVEDQQKKATEPERVRKEKTVALESVAIRLTPVDVVALRAYLIVGERSVHNEVKAGAALLKKMCPCLG